ncbi:VanZ family protein [Geoalkalibacter halelectricus]|uniref:VanZ family protein n=1 Tax=Geoalkalibacter halelectricus TaxID=2847045 RepID=A0ABY5ZJI9_9BACT|nr:VanZ family protein [Geoalkalibacter halelectricus]MDO3379755.1 VanZ family protein [Geoalkalibacter halelectricus]UWZ79288.1 VanZ family protein [Geoalkalibacter halelectricus]
MLIYGTLYPFRGWEVPRGGFAHNFLVVGADTLSKPDLITNFVVYLPFGLLWGGLFLASRRWFSAVLLAGLMGAGLSFCLETVQVFLPARVSAVSDLVLNGLGAVAGGGLAVLLVGRAGWGASLRRFRQEQFFSGSLANIGLLAACFWILSQLSPLVPSLGVSNLRHGLKPLWHSLSGQAGLVPLQALGYVFSVAGLGAIVLSLGRSRRFVLGFFAMALGMVLLLKVPVLSRQLSLEAVLGCFGALVLLFALLHASTRTLAFCAAGFLVLGFLAESLRPGTSTSLFAFNWVPFKGHMRNLVGLAGILWSSWIFLGLGFAVRSLSSASNWRPYFLWGMLGVFCLAFGVEWLQRSIPGRSPDMTDVLIALVAWTVAWTGVNERAMRSER